MFFKCSGKSSNSKQINLEAILNLEREYKDRAKKPVQHKKKDSEKVEAVLKKFSDLRRESDINSKRVFLNFPINLDQETIDVAKQKKVVRMKIKPIDHSNSLLLQMYSLQSKEPVHEVVLQPIASNDSKDNSSITIEDRENKVDGEKIVKAKVLSLPPAVINQKLLKQSSERKLKKIVASDKETESKHNDEVDNGEES